MHATYLASDGATGGRYAQRLEAAARMAEIDRRWDHLPGGFTAQRKMVETHIAAVAELAPSTPAEELCWLAVAAASAWAPQSENGRVSLGGALALGAHRHSDVRPGQSAGYA